MIIDFRLHFLEIQNSEIWNFQMRNKNIWRIDNLNFEISNLSLNEKQISGFRHLGKTKFRNLKFWNSKVEVITYFPNRFILNIQNLEIQSLEIQNLEIQI